jgi:hypothetical protein
MNLSHKVRFNMEVVLEHICRQLPNGGDHETRKYVAERLAATALQDLTTIDYLEEVAQHALLRTAEPAPTTS